MQKLFLHTQKCVLKKKKDLIGRKNNNTRMKEAMSDMELEFSTKGKELEEMKAKVSKDNEKTHFLSIKVELEEKKDKRFSVQNKATE